MDGCDSHPFGEPFIARLVSKRQDGHRFGWFPPKDQNWLRFPARPQLREVPCRDQQEVEICGQAGGKQIEPRMSMD